MLNLIDYILNNNFIFNSIIAAILAGVAGGFAGSFVVVKRISYISGAIAHTVVGGIGISLFLQINPMLGAFITAVTAAFIISFVTRNNRDNNDIIMSALWSGGMATGIIFAYLTPGYNVNLLSYLFGNILLVTNNYLQILFIIDLIIVIFFSFFYHQFLYVLFDEEYASIIGINNHLVYTSILVIISLTVVVLIEIVGVILVIAMLTLPPTIARSYSKDFRVMIILSVILIILVNLTGIAASFFLNLPSGATIVVLASFLYIINFAIRKS